MRDRCIRNYPVKAVEEFGEKVAFALMEGSIEEALGNKPFNILCYDEDVRPYIVEYLRGNCDSSAITYAAMRTKELEIFGEES